MGDIPSKEEAAKARKEDEERRLHALKHPEEAAALSTARAQESFRGKGLVEDINSLVHPDDDDPVEARGSGEDGVPAGTEEYEEAVKEQREEQKKLLKEAQQTAEKEAKQAEKDAASDQRDADKLTKSEQRDADRDAREAHKDAREAQRDAEKAAREAKP